MFRLKPGTFPSVTRSTWPASENGGRKGAGMCFSRGNIWRGNRLAPEARSGGPLASSGALDEQIDNFIICKLQGRSLLSRLIKVFELHQILDGTVLAIMKYVNEELL
jgi:hypothetical protein